MRLITFEPWHYEYLAGTTDGIPYIGLEAARLFGLAYYLRGISLSVMDGPDLVGCAGVIELWPGVGEAWSLFTDKLRAHKFFLHRKALKILRDMIESRKYHRVQTTVLCNNETAVRWIKRLGFTWESTMKQFGPDKSDHDMYVRSQ